MKQSLSSVFERGRAAQRKTIEGILEFAACVKELKDMAEVVPGKGTTFSADCKREWGLSYDQSSKWLKVATKSEYFENIRNCPLSLTVLSELASLTEDQFKAMSITPSTTRMDVVDYKMSLVDVKALPTPPEVITVIKEVESKEQAKRIAALEAKNKAVEANAASNFKKAKQEASAIWEGLLNGAIKGREEAKSEVLELLDKIAALKTEQITMVRDAPVADVRQSKIDMTRLHNQIAAAETKLKELESKQHGMEVLPLIMSKLVSATPEQLDKISEILK